MTQESDTLDTDRTPLDGLKRTTDHRHRFLRFDPTVSSGTLLQIMVLAGGAVLAYGAYREDRATTSAAIELVKATQLRDREDVTKALTSISGDVKDLKTKLDGVGENVAVLKGQTSMPAQRGPR